MLPENVKQIAAHLTQLPGIGPRQALRIALQLAESPALQKSFRAELEKLEKVKLCENCYLPHANSATLCLICTDSKRSDKIIAVVEKVTDLLSLEQSNSFQGKYLVLGALKRDGSLSLEQKQRLEKLKANGPQDEIIIALSPTRYGDLHANMLQSELKGGAKKFTRLGRGIPTGAEIEFADEQTLKEALKNRTS